MVSPSANPQGPDIAGVAVRWPLRGEVVGISRWQCLAHGAGVGAERVQPEHALVFLHGGCFERRDANGTALADANGVLLFNAGEPYRTSHPHGCGDWGSGIVLGDALAREVMAAFEPRAADRARPFARPYVPGPVPAALWHWLVRTGAGPVPDAERLAAEETALSIVAHVLRLVAPGPGRRGRGVGRDRALADYVRGRFVADPGGRHDLADLARAAGVSPFQLCRAFRRETGLPVHRYLTRLRLRSAMTRLPDPSLDLADLALDLGFANHSHFTAAFRREFGSTPSEARRARSIVSRSG